MGYHYLLNADLLGDLNYDGVVDLIDLDMFMEYWLDTGCLFPYFCHGRDLNEDGEVDFEDFALLAANWGLTETVPPRPNPMTWAITPHSATATSITMTATTARDNSASPVQYYFDETSGNPGATDSGWITSPIYTDSNLVPGARYGYRVKAKDARNNETGWSVIGWAGTEPNGPIQPPLPQTDSNAPLPNPSTWASVPQARQSPVSPFYWYHTMTATTAADASPPVEYYFECVTDSQLSSGWITEPNYTSGPFAVPNYNNAYRVRTRDSATPNRNVGNYSQTYHLLDGYQ